MAFALAKENEAFIARMIQHGRFNNQSEVVREALRRMERDEYAYLNPPPMTEEEADRIYAPHPSQDQQERLTVRASQESIRRLIKRKKLKLEDL